MPTRIVALGDSTTAGTPGFQSPIEAPPDGRGDETSQFAYWLMRAQPDWDVLNRGVNGERSDQIAARFERDVIGAAPAVVVIIAGVNDVYQGLAAGHVTDKLRTMYDRAGARGDPRRRRDHRSLQHGDGRPEPPDARDQRLDPGAGGRRAANRVRDTRAAVAAAGDPDRLGESPDGLHPSPAGYRRMADAIRPVLDRVLRGIL